MGRTCSTHGRDEKECNIWAGKPEGKRPLLERILGKQDGNLDWIHLVQENGELM
jgi:hypothetical protein